jgi:hypothetical protein
MDWLQWPALVFALAGAWLTGDADATHRVIGFILYILSDVLWIWWGWKMKQPRPWGFILMYIVFTFLSSRGLFNNWMHP